MATKKYTKDVQENFGHFKTSTGGGEPIPAGHKWTDEDRDLDQPRDKYGHFTYNAVNGKPLKEISKVHGHSRGTTIPPTLTGGDGTLHYYTDSSHKHIIKGAGESIKRHTELSIDEIYRKGAGVVSFKGEIAIAPRDFIESATEFIANKKSEAKLSGALEKAAEARKSGDKEALDGAIKEILESGHYKDEPTGSWSRKEAESDEEKRAVEKSKEEKSEGREIVEKEPEEEKEKEPTRIAPSRPSPVAPSAPGREKEEEIVESAPVSTAPKFSDAELKKAAEFFGQDSISSDELEEMVESGDIKEEELKAILEEKPAEEEKPSEPEKPEEEVEEKVEEKIEETKEPKEKGWKEMSEEEIEEKVNEAMSKILDSSALREEIVKTTKEQFGKEVEGLTDKAVCEFYIRKYIEEQRGE